MSPHSLLLSNLDLTHRENLEHAVYPPVPVSSKSFYKFLMVAELSVESLGSGWGSVLGGGLKSLGPGEALRQS